MGDAHQLQQVFLNLFANARHAMKAAHGTGTLTVRSIASDHEVLVEVEDDGPGIPAEHLGRIFDPFFTTKGAGEGTGLGLSLSIGIVEAHGGRMTAENLPDVGARFQIRLPADAVEDATVSEVAPSVARRTGRVLVVDDEDNLRAALVEVLTMLGHEVTQAATGQETLARLAEGSFDVVTLDLRLPDLDGKAVWQRILARDPQLAARVIFMTGDTMSPETQKFLEEAGRPVLTKPLRIDRVSQLVDEILAS
jgi:CheY-like chemotaxis protein